jgi:mono/diheme cytochrome c family protein
MWGFRIRLLLRDFAHNGRVPRGSRENIAIPGKPLSAACALLLGASALLAQHNYTPADVNDGARLYRANCSVCHGPEGGSVTGVDLFHCLPSLDGQ